MDIIKDGKAYTTLVGPCIECINNGCPYKLQPIGNMGFDEYVALVKNVEKQEPEKNCPVPIGDSNLYRALETAHRHGFSEACTDRARILH